MEELATQEEVENFIHKLIIEDSIDYERDTSEEEKRVRAMSDVFSEPPEPPLMEIDDGDLTFVCMLANIARAYGARDKVDFGYHAPSEPQEHITNIGFWISTMKGVRAFSKYISVIRVAHTIQDIMKVLQEQVKELPIGKGWLRDRWDEIHSRMKKDKKLYLEILGKTRVRMNPLVSIAFRPLDDEEDLKFPGVQGMLGRFSEEVGQKIDMDFTEDVDGSIIAHVKQQAGYETKNETCAEG